MIKDRLTPFSSLTSYISSGDLGFPSSVQDIAATLKMEIILEHPSKNAIFFDCFIWGQCYVLGKCLFRYDNLEKITVQEFTTANMRWEHYIPASNFATWIHLLRRPIHGMWMYFFSKLIAFCKESWIKIIRLVADETTWSELFYKKVAQRFSDSFERVTDPDCDWAIFFYLK